MKEILIEKINRVVYSKFPELIGKKPKVNSQPGEKYLLIYHGEVKMADGPMLNQSVRVICNSNGDVLKISSSRG